MTSVKDLVLELHKLSPFASGLVYGTLFGGIFVERAGKAAIAAYKETLGTESRRVEQLLEQQLQQENRLIKMHDELREKNRQIEELKKKIEKSTKRGNGK